MYDEPGWTRRFQWIAVWIGAALLLIVVMFGLWVTTKEVQRYQRRADAQNTVEINRIRIQTQAQRVKIAQQNAKIRFEEAKGIRKAQDTIAQTLTPLYVQHEMIQALAQSNANTVYIPTDPNSGLPVVTTRNASPTAEGK